MANRDFGAYYAALGLDPGATDEEIVRAKRAYNELYHSDRLAHMSDRARAIASEKVRAANEAAQALLDPANRESRARWRRTDRSNSESEGTPPQGGPETGPGPEAGSGRGWSPPSRASAEPVRRNSSTRLVLVGLAAGAVLGGIAVVGRTDESVVPAAEPMPAPPLPPPADPVVRRPQPGRAALSAAPVADSIVELPGDGRWTQAVATGGPGFRVSFIPESETTLYRVRVDGAREKVLLGEPGFRQPAEPAQRYEFSSLTGQVARLRFSRWRVGERRGRPVHSLEVALDPNGGWSRKVYFGELDVRWEPDRQAHYEAQDDRGRTIRILPEVSSVHYEVPPQWLRFRSVDSLPLTLAVRYTPR